MVQFCRCILLNAFYGIFIDATTIHIEFILQNAFCEYFIECVLQNDSVEGILCVLSQHHSTECVLQNFLDVFQRDTFYRTCSTRVFIEYVYRIHSTCTIISAYVFTHVKNCVVRVKREGVCALKHTLLKLEICL